MERRDRANCSGYVVASWALFTWQWFRLNPHCICKHCIAFAPSVYTATVKTIMISTNFWIREQKRKDLSSVVISSSCKHVDTDFIRSEDGKVSSHCSFFGPSDRLCWSLQARFGNRVSSELCIYSEKGENCVQLTATYPKAYQKGETLLDLTRQDATVVEKLWGGPCLTNWMEGKLQNV